MNNLEQKIKTICHQNFIGSEKCGQCNGHGGWSTALHLPISNWKDEPCPTCKGKGYTIPLEFGCEVLLPYYKDENDKQLSDIFVAFDCDEEIVTLNQLNTDYSDEFINLGKPLTLQMVLRLLEEKADTINIRMDNKYYELGTLQVLDNNDCNISNIVIDLTKDLKEQPEVLQAIIDIVK